MPCPADIKITRATLLLPLTGFEMPTKRNLIPPPKDVAQLPAAGLKALSDHWPSQWTSFQRSHAYQLVRDYGGHESGHKRKKPVLDYGVLANDQIPGQWTIYCDKIKNKVPELSGYLDDWFIKVLWDRYVHRSTKRRVLDRARGVSPSPVKPKPGGILYVGKRQAHWSSRRTSGISKGARTVEAARLQPMEDNKAVTLGHSSRDVDVQQPEDELDLLTPSQDPPLLTLDPSATGAMSMPHSQARGSSSTICASGFRWPTTCRVDSPYSPCPLCNFRPAIPPEDRSELEGLFTAVSDGAQLLHVLDTAGIYRDAHVAVLRGWTESQRMELWGELVARNAIAPLTIFALEDLFAGREDYVSAGVDESGAARKRWSIPRDERLVELASDAENPQDLLRDAMRMTNDEFASFKKTVTDYAHILRAEYCAEDQNTEDWKAVVKAVARDMPSLKQFEALWPVETMLRRIISAHQPHKQEEPADPPSLVASVRRMLMPPGLSRCSQHPLPNYTAVSSICERFLRKAGLSELMPFMITAGVHDDRAFSVLCRRNEHMQTVVLDSAIGKINLFQRLALRFALKKLGDEGFV